MKRIVLLITLVLGGSLLFAEGAQELNTPFGDAEAQTLSGTIDISQFPPVLKTESEEYLVMVPRFAVDGISVENGQEVVLEGYVHEALGRFSAEDQMVIAVTRATIDGEVYEVEQPRNGGRFAGGPGCCPPQQGAWGRMPLQGGYGGYADPRGQSGMMWGGNQQPQPRGWR